MNGRNHSKLSRYLIRRRMDVRCYSEGHRSRRYSISFKHEPQGASARWSIGGQGSFTLIGLNMIQANSEPSDGVAHTPFDGY